jgi:hypothetical protein
MERHRIKLPEDMPRIPEARGSQFTNARVNRIGPGRQMSRMTGRIRKGPEQIDKEADQREIEDEENDVSDIHAGDQPPEQLGLL